MKKSVIIVAIAMAFSVSSLNAKNVISNTSTSEVVTMKSTVSPLCVSIAKGDLETVKKLVGLGVDINKKSNGLTPAMYAAKYNRVDILKYLVEKGADIDRRGERGMTAEKYAKASNAKDALEYIKSLDS